MGNLRFLANTAERDRSGHLAPSGECKRNIVTRMGELRFWSHRASKHALLLRILFCVRWAFLVYFMICIPKNSSSVIRRQTNVQVETNLDCRHDVMVCGAIVELMPRTLPANVYCYPVDVADHLKQSDCSSSQSSLSLDPVPDGDCVTDDASLQSAMADTDPMMSCESDDDSVAMESFDDFEDFCIIDEPGLGIMVSFVCSEHLVVSML